MTPSQADIWAIIAEHWYRVSHDPTSPYYWPLEVDDFDAMEWFA